MSAGRQQLLRKRAEASRRSSDDDSEASDATPPHAGAEPGISSDGSKSPIGRAPLSGAKKLKGRSGPSRSASPRPPISDERVRAASAAVIAARSSSVHGQHGSAYASNRAAGGKPIPPTTSRGTRHEPMDRALTMTTRCVHFFAQ